MNSTKSLHPDKVLLAPSKRSPNIIAGCEHIAGNEKFINKAMLMQKELNGAFDITCDLEDGIAADGAIQAVDVILSALHATDNIYKQVGVRLPSFKHPDWYTCTKRLIQEGGDLIAYFTLPKLDHYFELTYIATCLQTIALQAGIQRQIPLHILIETKSLLNELDLVAQHSAVQAIDFGIMDFVADYDGAIDIAQIHSPAQFKHKLITAAKVRITQTALAAGIVPCHNITVNYADPDITYQDALRARSEFGFLRMWSIHPIQIKPIIKAMQPEEHEVNQACEILIAAYHKSWAPLGFEGILYDRASYRSLWQKVKRARKNGVVLSAECEQLFFAV